MLLSPSRFIAIAASLCSCFAAPAGIVTLPASKASRISVDNLNPGFISVFNIGGNLQRSVLEFDLSSIPNDANINSAILTLYGGSINFFGGQPTGTESDVYRITTPWAPLPTWVSPWTNPGGDFAPTIYAVNNAVIPDLYSGPIDWNVTDLVAEWISGTPNYGLLLAGTYGNGLTMVGLNGFAYDSPLLSPSLTVTYNEAIPEPSTFLIAGMSLPLLLKRRFAAGKNAHAPNQ